MTMSLQNNKTGPLWQTFMPRRHEVKHRVSTDYISLQKYGELAQFTPTTEFIKWALVEVSSFSDIPEGMKSYQIEGGRYAMFPHQGPAAAAAQTMQSIFTQWLPESGLIPDDREHFEILPQGYDPLDPNAREEIYIPIQ